MKIYIIYLMVFMGYISQPIYAQQFISGNIKDELTQKSLAGASVYISELRTLCTTDTNGNFAFININKGLYLFEISLNGYKKRVERIQINRDTILHFLLSEAVSELNEIVVTAVTRSTELKRSPIIIKPIDINALNQNSATNLIDALKYVPGVNQVTSGAGISKPVIRGLGYNRVISLYNGIRQEGQQWGDEHGIEIDEYAIDRIEIVKGPGSLMYGSDGIAGVLNFISPKAPPAGQNRSQLITNYQSNNNLIGYSLSNAGNRNGIQWLGRFSNKFAGNYQNRYDGKVYNSGFQENNGSLFLGVNKKWGYSHVNLSTYNTLLNLVTGDRDSLGRFVYEKPDGLGQTTTTTAAPANLKGYSIGFPHQEVNHLRILTNNYFILKKGSIHLDLGYQKNKRKEFGDAAHPSDMALFFDLATLNYNVRYDLIERKGWETSFGISGMQQTNVNRGLEFLIPAYSFLDMGGFIFSQRSIKKLTIAGGLRYDNRKINVQQLILDQQQQPVLVADSNTTLKFAAFTQNYHNYSGSMGFSYLYNKNTTIKFNLSRGFRAPNISELTSNGRHEGSLKYEYGNRYLKPEISHQIDLAYFLNSDHFSLELTPFTNFISNYIYAKKISSTLGGDSFPDPSEPSSAYKFTQNRAVLLGGEIYIDLHPHPLDWLHLGNSFSYVQATQPQQPDSLRYLPLIPAPKYQAEVKAQFKKLGKHLREVYIKVGLNHFFRQNNFYAADRTETATPAFSLLNFGMGTTVATRNKNNLLNIFLTIDNLTNTAYQSHLSRLKYAPLNPATGRTGVYNMGRNISLKVVLNI